MYLSFGSVAKFKFQYDNTLRDYEVIREALDTLFKFQYDNTLSIHSFSTKTRLLQFKFQYDNTLRILPFFHYCCL